MDNDWSKNLSAGKDEHALGCTQDIRENRAYLESEFGKEIFETPDTIDVPEGVVCPSYPNRDYLFTSKEMVKLVEERLKRSFELSCKRIGPKALGLSRRQFLKASGVVLAASMLPFGGTPTNLKGEAHAATIPAKHKNINLGVDGTYPTGRPCTNVDAFYTDNADCSVVGVAHGGSLEERVRGAIELAGGLGEIKPGQTVCIKPNVVLKMFNLRNLLKAPPTTTNPEVIRYVIRAVVERNQDPTKVFVAERSAILFATLPQLILSGIYDVAIEEGVNILPWENKPYVQFPLPVRAEYLKDSIIIPESIRAFDHLINVPVLKNHEFPAEYTLCIKAFVGVLHPNERFSLRHNLHDRNLGDKAAELNLCRPYVTMNIADATEVILTGGPSNGVNLTAKPKIIIASKDRVACDSVGVAVLKYHALKKGAVKNYCTKPVWQQRQIVHAGKLGLGFNDPHRIGIRSNTTNQTLSDIIRIWSEES